MKISKTTLILILSTLLISFSALRADVDFDVSDLFSLNTAFDEHSYSAVSGVFSLNTAFTEHRYSQISGLFGVDTDFQPDDRIVVEWLEGWNMVSLNIIPEEEFWINEDGPDVIRLMDHLRIDDENHHVELLKDQFGRFYLPAWGFNSIPHWELTEGYLVKIDGEGLSSKWYGDPIAADADIPLLEGWNIAAYFPTYELDASAPDFYVLSLIIDNVIGAKDAFGRFLTPAWNFSNMEPWRESQGYQIKADEAGTLNYPQEQEELWLASLAPEAYFKQTKTHWQNPKRTGANMSLLICFSDCKFIGGEQVAALNEAGEVVGVGVVQDERCGLAVWGDDETTEAVDGLRAGEPFALKLWNADMQIEQELAVNAFQQGSSLSYTANDLLVIDAAVKPGIPDEFFLSSGYPNPFNAVVRLNYGLPESSHLTIQVYDMMGREAATLASGTMPAGYHAVVWDGMDAASGSYFVRMEAAGFSKIQKVTLVK